VAVLTVCFNDCLDGGVRMAVVSKWRRSEADGGEQTTTEGGAPRQGSTGEEERQNLRRWNQGGVVGVLVTFIALERWGRGWSGGRLKVHLGPLLGFGV
jgi:hypothetical protein